MSHLISDEHGTRTATVEETQIIDIVRADYETSRQTELAQIAAKQSAMAKLAALGLTADEIAALVGA